MFQCSKPAVVILPYGSDLDDGGKSLGRDTVSTLETALEAYKEACASGLSPVFILSVGMNMRINPNQEKPMAALMKEWLLEREVDEGHILTIGPVWTTEMETRAAMGAVIENNWPKNVIAVGKDWHQARIKWLWDHLSNGEWKVAFRSVRSYRTYRNSLKPWLETLRIGIIHNWIRIKIFGFRPGSTARPSG
ncbi:MAG TPA: ElyC/SanA/YdcF family protein [Candidatus Paceibacterota bacterium]|nr:ElyC/SanA/YdcF family protein [Candidatus Paceibacterota bacterium]